MHGLGERTIGLRPQPTPHRVSPGVDTLRRRLLRDGTRCSAQSGVRARGHGGLACQQLTSRDRHDIPCPANTPRYPACRTRFYTGTACFDEGEADKLGE